MELVQAAVLCGHHVGPSEESSLVRYVQWHLRVGTGQGQVRWLVHVETEVGKALICRIHSLWDLPSTRCWAQGCRVGVTATGPQANPKACFLQIPALRTATERCSTHLPGCGPWIQSAGHSSFPRGAAGTEMGLLGRAQDSRVFTAVGLVRAGSRGLLE